MIKEPSIAISRINQALNCEVALGRISEEAAEIVKRSLMLDLEKEKWEHQQNKEGFCELLADLLKQYDAQIGTNNGGVAEFELRFGHFGYAVFDRNELDAETVRTFPKQHKRVEMFYKVLNSFGKETQQKAHIDKMRPMLAATKRIGGWNKVTDKQYKAMLDEFNEYLKSL